MQRFQFRSQRGRDGQAAVRLLAHGQAQRLRHFHRVIREVAIRALAVDGWGGPVDYMMGTGVELQSDVCSLATIWADVTNVAL